MTSTNRADQTSSIDYQDYPLIEEEYYDAFDECFIECSAPAEGKASKSTRETLNLQRATVTFDVIGDEKLPVIIKYDSQNTIEFVRCGGKLTEVKFTSDGKDTVWATVDGVNFKLKGANEEAEAKITYENGKVTLDSSRGGRSERTQYLPDGSMSIRLVDAADAVWTTTRSADGHATTVVVLADSRRVAIKFDRDGAKQCTIYGTDGKPQIAYTRVPGGDTWLKYDLSQKPPKAVPGKLAFEVGNPEPKFKVRDGSDKAETLDSAEQRKVNLAMLQTTLIGGFPATAETELSKIGKEFENKFLAEIEKLNLPDNLALWTQDQREQIDQLKSKIQQEQNVAAESAKEAAKSRLEAVEAERKRGEFGPATRQMYQEYVNWLQTTGLPAYLKMQSQMMASIPADSPQRLPILTIPGLPNIARDYMDPGSFRLQAGDALGLPPINLELDTTTDGAPSLDDLRKLGKALLWMQESQIAIEDVRRQYDVNTLIPRAIEKNGLPSGWHFDQYPGRDADAYRSAYLRVSEMALRTRNLIVSAVDADKLNLAQSHNWIARDINEIRSDLGIPAEWTLDIDPKTKKITSLNLDLPDTLDQNDPVVKEKLARLEAWLNGPGKKIETAVEDAIAKEKDPSKFLYCGVSEMPKGYKFKAADGTEVECNVLRCDLTAQTKNGKIVVTYTIQPQNAHLLSYQNLSALCKDAGKPFVEQRTYDPDEFVMVRHGMEGIQMLKARDLDAWVSSQRFKHRAEFGLMAAMDMGMIVSGAYGLKAIKTATELGAKEAIKLTGREIAISRALNSYRIGLGATGVFNNAGTRQWNPGGYNVGQWLLDARGLAFVADVALSLPSQIKALAGAGKGLESGTRLWKLEEAAQTFSNFHKLVNGVNKLQMTLANFGFAPMIFTDLAKQVSPKDIQDDLDGLRTANDIINGLEKKTESTTETDTATGRKRADEIAICKKVLESYEKQMGQNADEATKTELKYIAHETARLLELRESNQTAFQKEVAEFKAKLMAHFRNGDGAAIAEWETRMSNRAGERRLKNWDKSDKEADIKAGGPKDVNKELQVAAATALLLLNRDRDGNLDLTSVAARREIQVPGFTYLKVVTTETGTGASKKQTKKMVHERVEAHEHEQTIQVNDLFTILKSHSTNRESGPRRLVAADAQFHAGTMEAATYATILKDVLTPPKGLTPPNEADREWALERIGFFANAQRVIEASQHKTLDRNGRAAEAGKMFGASAHDLEDVLLATAKNPVETPENRIRAAYILRCLKESPDKCQQMLQQMIADTRGKDCENVLLEKLKAELDHPVVEKRFSAALALDLIGKIKQPALNEVMMQCFDSANPELRANAVNALKANSPDDLSPDQRQRLFNLMHQYPSDSNQPAQVALLNKIHKLVKAEDIKELTDKIGSFINPEAVRYAKNSTDLRIAAIKALGSFNQTGTASWIETCLKDDSAKVRIVAMETLVKVGAPNLDKLLDAQRSKENDFAARQVLDNLRLSVPRQTDEEAYKRQWEKLDREMPTAWYKPGTSSSAEGIDEYIFGKFGKEKNAQNGNENALLYDFDNLMTSAWRKHTGDNSLGDTWARGIDRLARNGISLVYANFDTNPYSSSNQNNHVRKWSKRVDEQIAKIIEEANSANPDQAIAALAYVARNGAAKFSPSLRDKVEQEFSQALIDMVKARKEPGAALAMQEIYSSLTDYDIKVQTRKKYLHALSEFVESGMLTKDRAAHIIFQSMFVELKRTGCKAPPKNEREAAVDYWTTCLEEIALLNPVGYLGPHYDAGVRPVLQHMAYNHPFKEIREEAERLIEKLQDSAIERYIEVMPEKGLSREEAAKRIRAALNNCNNNPDKVIHEIAKVVRYEPITEADDPRIQALRGAFKGTSEKVKIAAAWALGGFPCEKENISVEVKLEAVRAVAQVVAAGIYYNKQAWIDEATNAMDFLRPGKSRDQFLALHEQVVREELERLRNTSPRQKGEEIVGKIDGSVLHYNKDGQIIAIQRPKRDMAVTGLKLTWQGSDLKTIQHPNGNTWTREFKEGKPTNSWLQDGKPVFRGDITVMPDGTILLDKIRAAGETNRSADVNAQSATTSIPQSYTILRTDGLTATVEYDNSGKPTKVTRPNGQVTEYNYDDSGKLIAYGSPDFKHKVKNGLEVGTTTDVAEIRVGPRGELIRIGNEGIARILDLNGLQVSHYEGPPAHLKEAGQQLKQLIGANLTGEEIAGRMEAIVKATGPIIDERDPRYIFLHQAILSPNSKVADKAEVLLKPEFHVDRPAAEKPSWDFSDRKQSFEARLAMAQKILADRSLGAADHSRQEAALNVLTSVCRAHKESEQIRMVAINALLKTVDNRTNRHLETALQELAQIATTGRECKQAAITILRGLDPAAKEQVLDYITVITEDQMKEDETKPGKQELESRLRLIADEYVSSKGDLNHEAQLWRMLAATCGSVDKQQYSDAFALIDRQSGFPFKPIAGKNDPRLRAMHHALKVTDTNVKLSAALTLLDRANQKDAVDEFGILRALSSLGNVAESGSARESERLLAIKVVLTETAGKKDYYNLYDHFSKRALSNLAKIATSGAEHRHAAMEVINGLDETRKEQAIEYMKAPAPTAPTRSNSNNLPQNRSLADSSAYK